MKNFYLLVLLLLSGCSHLNVNNIAPGYVQAYQAIKNAVKGYENTLITSELVNNIPYASSLIAIGIGPSGLMILESKQEGRSVWVTADGVYLVLKKGKIIETKGLPNNLTNMLLPSYFQKEGLQTINQKDTLTYYYSYDEPELTDLEVKASYQNMGLKKVSILEKDMELTLIHEKISNEYIGWNVLNKYWLDKKGFVWKSQQYISPLVPIIHYEITKKPSS